MTDRKTQFVHHADGTTETFTSGDKRPTDLERLLDWYRSVGIEPRVTQAQARDKSSGVVTKLVFDGMNGRGHTTILFTPEGKFIRQDFWE